jgi:serine/tyrosine/threonine adenylyltransferase
LDEDEDQALTAAKAAIGSFAPSFNAAYQSGLQRKVGLAVEREGDAVLIHDLLTRMAENSADFTLTFRRLCAAAADPERDAAVRVLFADANAYDTWAARWRHRLMEEVAVPDVRYAAMRAVNPAFIPRNHLLETAFDAAVAREDFTPFEELLEVSSRPYEERPGYERYVAPPAPEERVQQTFCST